MRSSNQWSKKRSGVSKLLYKIQQNISSVSPNAEIILYGSRARGDARDDSDWDLLILVDQVVDSKLTTKLRDCLYDIELETNQILSSIIRSKQDWYSPKYSVLPFKRRIEQEGRVI